MIDKKAAIEAYKLAERNAHDTLGDPAGYLALTGSCPVAMVERQAQRLAALLAQLDEAEAALAAQRQRADKAQADMQFECDAHIETAESWREWKLRAVTAEEENAELRAKLANPVASPRVEGLFRQVQFERDCEWIDEIRKAGFTVKGG